MNINMIEFNFKEQGDVGVKYSSEPHYDLLNGGYIDPEELLFDPQQAEIVYQAMCTINCFLAQAEEVGLLEIT